MPTLNIPIEVIAVVHPIEGGGYWAEVPCFPGCVAQAETLENLRETSTLLGEHHHRFRTRSHAPRENAARDALRPLALDPAVIKDDAERRRLHSHGGPWERERPDGKFVVAFIEKSRNFRQAIADWLADSPVKCEEDVHRLAAIQGTAMPESETFAQPYDYLPPIVMDR